MVTHARSQPSILVRLALPRRAVPVPAAGAKDPWAELQRKPAQAVQELVARHGGGARILDAFGFRKVAGAGDGQAQVSGLLRVYAADVPKLLKGSGSGGDSQAPWRWCARPLRWEAPLPEPEHKHSNALA